MDTSWQDFFYHFFSPITFGTIFWIVVKWFFNKQEKSNMAFKQEIKQDNERARQENRKDNEKFKQDILNIINVQDKKFTEAIQEANRQVEKINNKADEGISRGTTKVMDMGGQLNDMATQLVEMSNQMTAHWYETEKRKNIEIEQESQERGKILKRAETIEKELIALKENFVELNTKVGILHPVP